MPDEGVECLLLVCAGYVEIEQTVIDAGMVTMFDIGLNAAFAADTTIEEVVRSIRAEA